MAKKFGERFLEWQNYVHYLMLAGSVFVIHWLTDVTGVEANAVALGGVAWLWLVLFYAGGLLVFDSLIHALFWFAPKNIRWRD